MRLPSFFFFIYLSSLLVTRFTGVIQAAPYFYITGEPSIYYGDTNIYSVFLYTDSQTLTAAQTIVTFNSSILEKSSYSILASRCNFWSPADPDLGYGNATTPYFYNNNQLVLACGFSNPGFTSVGTAGSLIAKFSVYSKVPQGNTTQFTFSNHQLRYIGTSIDPGASTTFSLTVFGASASATPTPVPAAALDQDVLTLDQITFQEVGTQTRTSSSLTTSNTATLAALPITTTNNDIPPAPEFTPRPTTTPYVLPTAIPDSTNESGSVLSVQSLRELFIPGKSSADQTIVLINLISLLAFLIILTILVWRLLVISRLNKIKQRHMKDLIAGELSVLETKLGSGSPQEKEEMANQLESLKETLEKV
jgi:hypothetical protein